MNAVYGFGDRSEVPRVAAGGCSWVEVLGELPQPLDVFIGGASAVQSSEVGVESVTALHRVEDHGFLGFDTGDPDFEEAAVSPWADAHDRVVVHVPDLSRKPHGLTSQWGHRS
ncbi:MAG: hypothetical protein ACJ764_09320 [Solirubrobacteraceae bacterium]